MTNTAQHDGAPATASATDTRADFHRAIALAGHTISALRPEHYDAPTPCPDYTVRDVANHQLAVLRRLVVLGRGEDPFALPVLAEDVSDGAWSAPWDAAARDMAEVWDRPGVLAKEFTLPFGTLTGAAILGVYVTEFSVHTWDLAVATGLRPAWDDALLERALAAMRTALSAERRGEGVPFGPVVEIAPDAPAADRLAAWSGHARPAGDAL
ncbi:TIGR03086 family metal-binding protein [Streptomyces sp. NPDC048111]|uniref:TIGR03086 family metal-binding protein n=1 Tax=Streptomyces sp. NPDC048111 TaxID=3365500 RepID=UPI00372251D1